MTPQAGYAGTPRGSLTSNEGAGVGGVGGCFINIDETEFNCIRWYFTDEHRTAGFFRCFHCFKVPWAEGLQIRSRNTLRMQRSQSEVCEKQPLQQSSFIPSA